MIHPVILKPNIGGNGLLNNLIGAWLFDETSGSVAYDAVGNNDGTNNGATINQTGKLDKCYLFDGVDDYVSMACPTVFDDELPNNFTISFWLKIVTKIGYKRVLDIDGVDCNITISENYNGDNILLRMYSTNAFDLNYMFHESLTTGNWYHFLLTWDATTQTPVLYVNGNNVTTSTGMLLSLGYGSMMVVGARAGHLNGFSNIEFDQLLIYNAILTSEQISALYNSGSGLPFSNFTN